jgi:murein DD-endopeptidase
VAFTLIFASILAGCSSTPTNPIGNEVTVRAIALIGTPYRYGGSTPAGFDCSGLVQYVYSGVGYKLPRTAQEQFDASKPIDLRELVPGDLLFFRTSGRRISHVAIYAGENRFIHAPTTGRRVELRPLKDEYYFPRLIRAGRVF